MNDDLNDDVAWGSCLPDTPIAWFQQRMALSGLTRAVADKCGIHLGKEADNFKIPYHTIDAVPTLFIRQRNRQEQLVYEKAQSGAEFRGRYTQPKGSKNRVYWPSIYTQRVQYNDPSTPLIICEGELKAIRCKMACAESAIDMLVCGVPGTELGEDVYADLNSIPCTTTVADIKVHRTVFLALDWNGKGRSKEASLELEYVLREMFQLLGAKVVNLRWPVEDGAGEQKLDEWLTQGGDLSAALQDSFETKKAENSELQTMWDRLNKNYTIMHGFYIPLTDTTRKYTSRNLDIMEADLRIPLSKSRVLRASDIWDLQPIADRNVCHGYKFAPAPLGHAQDRYVWEDGLRYLNTAPEWRWDLSPIGYGEPADVMPFLALVGRLCQGEHEWYLNFLAQIAQQPMIRGHHVIMFQDKGNTGKDRLFDTLTEVFKGYAGPVGTGLTSSFNANMEHLLIPFWSDPVVHGAVDRFLEAALKNYSGTTLQEINHKGGAKYSVQAYGRLHIAFNMDYLVTIQPQERRYAVFGGNEAMSYEWAKEYMAWLNSGGVDKIRQFLSTRDISNFDIFAPAPRTGKRSDMEVASRPPLEAFLANDEYTGYKDIWSITSLCELRKIMDGATTSGEMMGKAVRRMHDVYAHDKLIKVGGVPLRLVALRRGKYWEERLANEGNSSWVKELEVKKGGKDTKF